MRLNLMQSARIFSLTVGTIAVAVCSTTGAQTTSTYPPVKKAATRIRAVKTATSAVARTASQTAAPVVTPASSQTVLSSSTPVSTAVPANTMNSLSSTGTNTLSNTVNGLSSAGTNAVSGLTTAGTNAVNGVTSPGANGTANEGQAYTGGASNAVAAGDPGTPVGGLGVGSFVAAGWNLTAYGCFRTGTRLFCDFDTTYRRNLQAGTNIWGPVKLVDDGGKITVRHNAFFVGDDGSQFQTAYITPSKPTRFIIEYDDVDQRYTSISLVHGREQIQAVPITIMNPNQAAGTMPARASAKGATR